MPIYAPSPDALSNVTIITAVPLAEYGNANGGHILTVIKSGTNSCHGSAAAALQNWKMDANTFGNKLVLPGNAFNARSRQALHLRRLSWLSQAERWCGEDERGAQCVVPNAWCPWWCGNTTATSFDKTVSPLAGYAYFDRKPSARCSQSQPVEAGCVGTSAPYYSTIGNGSVTLLESEGNFNFNAGEVTYRQRPAHGLEITANYTYSKNLSDTNGPITINDVTGAQSLPQNSNNLGAWPCRGPERIFSGSFFCGVDCFGGFLRVAG